LLRGIAVYFIFIVVGLYGMEREGRRNETKSECV
jgi:hypothetical protein